MKKLRTYLSLTLALLLSQIFSVAAVFAAGEVITELNTETKKIAVPYSNQNQTVNTELKLSLIKSESYNSASISDAKVKVTTSYNVSTQQGTNYSTTEYLFKNSSNYYYVPITVTVPKNTPAGTYKVKVLTTITNTATTSDQKVYNTVDDYVEVEVLASDTVPPTAQISYSTTDPTNQNVVATLVNESEPIIVTNNGGSKSYAFTENGSFTFEFKDVAGNSNTAVAIVNNIDKIDPTATVSYSKVDPTNQNVIATITPNEYVAVTNNSGSFSKEFTANGSFVFEFIDAAGNRGSATATVNNIDKENPTAGVEYSTTNPTNQNVEAWLVNESEQITMTNNDGSKSYMFKDNDSFTFQFEDAAGNPGSATATVRNIDRESPTADIEYSTTKPTNQNVTVTLVNESENIIVTNNDGSKSYTFTKNGSFTFEFKDAAGNFGYKTATVENIDKEAPTATVTYSESKPTNKDVLAILNPSEPITVTNNGGSWDFTFSDNGTFTFEFEDAAGNKGTATASVENIDKEPPTATVEYSETKPTNQNVTVTLKPSEEVTVMNNNGQLTRTFEKNGTFVFEFEDAAGNAGTATATVENIDKEPPTATVEYSETKPTNQNVTVTLKPSEEVTVMNNDGQLTRTFEKNGTFVFEFEDAAGNKGTATATVENIDKEPPTATVEYSETKPTNQNVTVTLKPSEEVTVINNDGQLTRTFEKNGTFVFEFEDAAGNKGTATATVENIDKEPPTATVEYSETKPTNQNVTATLKPSEEVTVTNNDGQLTRTFEKNGTFVFEFEDAAGNRGSTTAEVGNIDKVAPTAEVSYSTTDPTNKDIVVNLVNLSESIFVTNNGGLLSYTFKENGSFTFEFIDMAGNPGFATATVKNIDKEAPTATVEYSTTSLTNKNVTATIFPSEEVTVTNNDGSLSYTFTKNGSFTFEFVDAAGNPGSITATVNNIDKVEPELSIIAPTEKTYYLNETVLADWRATDASGIVSEEGTVEKGKVIDTSTPGTHTFTVKVTDAAGNETTKTVQYNVIYKSSGVLQPINSNKSSVFKLGSTIPVKFQLFDVNSKFITDATATIRVAKVSNNVVGDYQEVVSTSAATTGNLFRYDSVENQYIFNLSTKNGFSTGTYSILVEIKNGLDVIQSETAVISMK